MSNKGSSIYKTGSEDASRYAAGYAEFMRRSTVRHAAAKAIAEGVDRFASSQSFDILDIGCNDGAMTKLYVEQMLIRHPARSLHIRLIEPAEAAIAVAAKRLTELSPAPIIVARAETVESLLSNETVPADLVSVLWVFYHLDTQLITPLLKLVRSQGRLLIAMGGPNHPIRTPGILASSSKHGGNAAVERQLDELKSHGTLDYKKEEVPTELDLRGLWSAGLGMTLEGENFFSFMFNVDYEDLTDDVRTALHERVQSIFESDGGIAKHSHYLYWVTPVPSPIGSRR